MSITCLLTSNQPNCVLPSITCFTQYYLLVCILRCAFIFADKALDRDNYMTPEMAKEFGVIDHIVGNTPVAEEENKWRSCR